MASKDFDYLSYSVLKISIIIMDSKVMAKINLYA
jgi:hypothetical protein